MKSYHNNPAIKQKYIDRVKEHQRLDNLVQGYGYWENGKGCAVGCTLEVDNYVHEQYPIELGLPEWLAHLEDHLFENLPKEDSRNWPLEFLQAIPVGVDEKVFDGVRDRFQIFWLERQKTQIEQSKYPSVVDALNGVIRLLELALEGNESDSSAWSAAESAAWSAARSATRSATRSVAWSAAWSAAESAARSAARSAAESAARSATRSATRSAAESAAWSATRSAAESAARSATRSATRSAAESAARSAAESEAIVKRDWLLAELKALK